MSSSSEFQKEVGAGQRFEFGKNWKDFLLLLNPERIEQAEISLKAMLGREDLAGSSFLDIGNGSGLFSLAARRMGASVSSFDYDPNSVACCQGLRDKMYPNDPGWTVREGSILDADFLSGLGRFDIVYSWGVLHHTGAMWTAISNAAGRVKPDGLFYIAIYNDQGWKSSVWKALKSAYNRVPSPAKRLFEMPLFLLTYSAFILKYTLLLKPWIPLAEIRSYRKGRGMDMYVDWKDWIGGYPFEVASVEAIRDFMEARGFRMDRVKAEKSLGCNEFLFTRISGS